VTLTGPATYVVDSVTVGTGTVLVDATAGPVYVYVLDGFEVQNTGTFHSTREQAADLLFFLDADNITGYETTTIGDPDKPLSLRDNGSVNGVLYAPNGVVNIDGDAEVYGSVTAKRVRMGGTSSIHYDEALARLPWLATGSGTAQTWTVLQQAPSASATAGRLICWREVHRDTVPQSGDPVGHVGCDQPGLTEPQPLAPPAPPPMQGKGH
jgi:hypothetical protein